MCIKSSTREGSGCAFVRDMLGLFKVDSVSNLLEFSFMHGRWLNTAYCACLGLKDT